MLMKDLKFEKIESYEILSMIEQDLTGWLLNG